MLRWRRNGNYSFDTSLISIGFFVIVIDWCTFLVKELQGLPRSSNISWLFYAFYSRYNYFWTVNKYKPLLEIIKEQ